MSKHSHPTLSPAARQAAVLEAHANTLREQEAEIDKKERQIDSLDREIEVLHRRLADREREIQRLQGELTRRGPINPADDLALAKKNVSLHFRVTSQGKVQATLTAPSNLPILADSAEEAIDRFFRRTPLTRS